MDASLPLLALPALLLINLVTFLQFGFDKRRAVQGRRRVPESTLLGWALIGGTPGALLARCHFRHKTRKQPFSVILLSIAVVHVGAVAGIASTLF